MLDDTRIQVDVETEFGVISLNLMFSIFASIKLFVAFCMCLETAKDC